MFSWKNSYDYWIPFELLDAGVKTERFDVAAQSLRKLLDAGHHSLCALYSPYFEALKPYFDEETRQRLMALLPQA